MGAITSWNRWGLGKAPSIMALFISLGWDIMLFPFGAGIGRSTYTLIYLDGHRTPGEHGVNRVEEWR